MAHIRFNSFLSFLPFLPSTNTHASLLPRLHTNTLYTTALLDTHLTLHKHSSLHLRTNKLTNNSRHHLLLPFADTHHTHSHSIYVVSQGQATATTNSTLEPVHHRLAHNLSPAPASNQPKGWSTPPSPQSEPIDREQLQRPTLSAAARLPSDPTFTGLFLRHKTIC